jgi:HTH-type transcriptional regulator, transcriptional repressor of NAD biosynthesis genes
MKTVGITIGKFYPFHIGHELMINFGAKMVDKLFVFVSGKETDTIPLSKRFNWICKFVKDNNLTNVMVIHHIDDSPIPVNIDENGTVLDPEFQQYWKEEFSLYVPNATHFISSDRYGKTMADLLGIEWLPVDPNREMIDISGTQIRNDPVTHFNYISDVAKPHFVRKIAIVGPESSGKSTMVEELAYFFGSQKVNEYGRTISEAKENNLDKQDFLNIMNGQQVLIDIVSEKALSPFIFIDTEAYTTYLFSKIYLGEYIDEILEFGHKQEIDHYIVLSPDVEWIDDGSRILGEYDKRKQFYEEIINILDKQNKSYDAVEDTDYRKRFWCAVDSVRYVKSFLTHPI